MYLKRLLVFGMCGVLLAGCGKKEPTDQEQVETKLQQNEFFKALGKTPVNRIPSAGKKDTLVPDTCWRIVGDVDKDYTIIVTPGEADIPVTIKWLDTLVVVYNDTLTKKVPAPYHTGNLTFKYKVIDDKWEFYSLTPCKIVSDSADGYVKIDSIQIRVNGNPKPTLTSPEQMIPAYPIDDYPYIFSVEDSITLRVYKSGTLSDSVAWVFLHVPLGDRNPGFFHNIQPGVWQGTWVVQTPQAHWGWVSVFDIGVLIYTDQMAQRDELWGIPYKVQ